MCPPTSLKNDRENDIYTTGAQISSILSRFPVLDPNFAFWYKRRVGSLLGESGTVEVQEA